MRKDMASDGNSVPRIIGDPKTQPVDPELLLAAISMENEKPQS
jgi:hypothetical protein